MPKKNTNPTPDARVAWERQPGETETAFAAYCAYRDLGADRTQETARKNLGKRPGYARAIEKWSTEHRWVERCRAFDNHAAQIEQEARDRASAEYAERWQRRRLAAASENWRLGSLLATRAREMLKAPLFEQEVTHWQTDPETGERRPVAVSFSPLKWNAASAAAYAKTAAELKAAAVAVALGSQDDDGFDPMTATPDECLIYLKRHGVKGLPSPAGGHPTGGQSPSDDEAS